MSIVVFAKEAVIEALKEQYPARRIEEDLCISWTVAQHGIEFRVLPDEYFEGLKTKDGEDANAFILDTKYLKLYEPTVKLGYDSPMPYIMP